MKNNIFFLAITTLFLRGLQSVNAQGIIGKIKKKVEEVKPTTATEPTQKTDESVVSNNKINIKDVFREAAPLFRDYAELILNETKFVQK